MIDGHRYNQIRLGLLRIENPMRLELPGLRGMDIVLDDNSWVCVDRTLYDLPVLAWTNFEVTRRASLHEPVRCLLHYYHIHAELIKETVLNTVLKEIAKRARNLSPSTSINDITALPQTGKSVPNR
ncbi:MAG: hypothetical protein HY940_00255 [Gammaproteobacteria bacterium]|nr:hypothetical protein [Gammaproteobacteria bacterium]